jgi:hypothetical protein
VSLATFVSSRAADELRGRTAFDVARLLRATVLGRCAFAGSPPALERRRIAAPNPQDEVSGISLARLEGSGVSSH